MFQNIKVDVIYYKTPTDFEMEFNLSGCCRMRLLTDKAPDRKILVNQMVRAVTRSRIIIISGALFGEDNIIETCSKAIGKPVTQIDNAQYGIDFDDEINIIKDAIPLVSADGIFGGCIIEQGPQTLILITENKNIRKGIMQNLIHPYIKEIVAGELSTKEEPTELIDEPAEEPLEAIPQETPEELLEEEVPEAIDAEPKNDAEEIQEPVNQLIMDDEDDEDLEAVVTPESEEEDEEDASQEEALDLYVESSRGRRAFKTSEAYYTAYDSEEYITDQFDESSKVSGKGLNISIIVLSAVLLLVVGILCYCIFTVPESTGMSAGAYLKDTINTLLG